MGRTIRLGLTQPLRGWYHVRSSPNAAEAATLAAGCNRFAVELIGSSQLNSTNRMLRL